MENWVPFLADKRVKRTFHRPLVMRRRVHSPRTCAQKETSRIQGCEKKTHVPPVAIPNWVNSTDPGGPTTAIQSRNL